jgi:nitrogen fixation protein
MQVIDANGNMFGYDHLEIIGANGKPKTIGGGGGPYVPYTGATGNVDLGEFELKAGQLSLDTTPTGTAAVGTTRWNDAIGSSETTLKGGTVILKNGVDLVARVVNKVTPNATLTKANYTAVRVSGAQGQRLAVAYAQADSDANSADTIGLVIETIATNQEGFVITVGQLEEVNTTGSLQGETWADGDVLYLSPTTPGGLTNIKPTGLTGHIVVMGYVEYAHAIHGKIYVKIMNGWELDELHNVYINPGTLANNNLLQYDSTDQLWKNKSLSSAGIQPTITPGSLTKTDDTNVTITLGGSPSNALLQAVSLVVGWTGTLADSRIASAATWNAKQNAITLTTTGTSGPATLVGSTLNIPQYSGGGGGASIIKLVSQTLLRAGWSLLGGYYVYTFSNVNITTNTRVDFTPDNSAYTEVTTCGMLPQVDVAAGTCRFFSLFPPQSDILGEITIFPTI